MLYVFTPIKNIIVARVGSISIGWIYLYEPNNIGLLSTYYCFYNIYFLNKIRWNGISVTAPSH